MLDNCFTASRGEFNSHLRSMAALGTAVTCWQPWPFPRGCSRGCPCPCVLGGAAPGQDLLAHVKGKFLCWVSQY